MIQAVIKGACNLLIGLGVTFKNMLSKVFLIATFPLLVQAFSLNKSLYVDLSDNSFFQSEKRNGKDF